MLDYAIACGRLASEELRDSLLFWDHSEWTAATCATRIAHENERRSFPFGNVWRASVSNVLEDSRDKRALAELMERFPNAF